MKFYETFMVALSSLRTNLLRSALTVLGIIVGIFSIISISTVISMLQTSIETGVSALGKNTFQIQKWPAIQMSREERMRIMRNRRNIDIEEFHRLKEVLVDAKGIGAEMWEFGKIFQYGNNKTNPDISLGGITPEGFANNNWVVDNGREFNSRDIESYSKSIIIGVDIAKTLFENINPVGQEIKVSGAKLTVIGVLESQGAIFGQSQDNFCIIPISTFQAMYGKERSVNITVMAHSKEDYNSLIESAIGHFRKIRKVEPGKDDDFSIRTNEAILEQINETTEGVKIGAFVVAAIALLAAGIGIMNIMLVSVTERTREIGIRKAIGAKKKNILVQFLIEAVTLSLIGGVVGIILGVIVGNFAGSLLDATTVIPFLPILVGVSLCVLIGIVFGTYPAYKAANLDPIEALRYE